MNITSAQHVQDDDGVNASISAIIDGQQFTIPLDPANRHYVAILEWAEEDGNTIEEAE